MRTTAANGRASGYPHTTYVVMLRCGNCVRLVFVMSKCGIEMDVHPMEVLRTISFTTSLIRITDWMVLPARSVESQMFLKRKSRCEL